MMICTKDEFLKEISTIKNAIRMYNIQRDTYRCCTIQSEMMKFMSGRKGDDISQPEMVLALKFIEHDVSIQYMI